MNTTNYRNTFIEVAPDSKALGAEEPPARSGPPTVAELQYRMVTEHPYRYSSDDVLFAVYAERAGLPEAEWPSARAEFFAKDQACFRASPLPKRYGWGVHHDAEERIALVPQGSRLYEELQSDPDLTHLRAMRSSRD